MTGAGSVEGAEDALSNVFAELCELGIEITDEDVDPLMAGAMERRQHM